MIFNFFHFFIMHASTLSDRTFLRLGLLDTLSKITNKIYTTAEKSLTTYVLCVNITLFVKHP